MIGLVAGTLVLLFVIYFFKKHYFSPLTKIPEPPSWPILGHTPYFSTNKDHLSLRKKWANEFKKEGLYGLKVIHFRSYIVSLLKPEYVKIVLSKPSLFPRVQILKDFLPLLENGLLASIGEDHRFQKKLLGRAFSLIQMKHYMPVFNRHVAVLKDIWIKEIGSATVGKKLDVKKYINDMAFDIISDAAFGYSSCSQVSNTSEFVSTFKHSIEGVLMNFSIRFLMRIFPFLTYLPFGPGKTLKDGEKAAIEIMNKVLEKRKEKIAKGDLTEEEKNDMLSIMLNERDGNTNGRFSDQVIKDNIFTFFVAGHETSATAIPIALLFLAKYPDMQEKARLEIKERLNEKEELSLEDTNSVPYTTAFIKESLRMLPAVPLNGRFSSCDYQFGKYIVPKGTFLSFPHYVLNEDEDDFDNPYEFMPERYLDDSGMKTGTSFTFGYGPYSCIGKGFAMQEIKVSIIRLLQNFRFAIDSGDDVFSFKMGITLKPTPAMLIRVIPLKN